MSVIDEISERIIERARLHPHDAAIMFQRVPRLARTRLAFVRDARFGVVVALVVVCALSLLRDSQSAPFHTLQATFGEDAHALFNILLGGGTLSFATVFLATFSHRKIELWDCLKFVQQIIV